METQYFYRHKLNASLGIGLCGEKFLYEKQTPSCCERVQSPLGTNKSEPLPHAILDSFRGLILIFDEHPCLFYKGVPPGRHHIGDYLSVLYTH